MGVLIANKFAGGGSKVIKWRLGGLARCASPFRSTRRGGPYKTTQEDCKRKPFLFLYSRLTSKLAAGYKTKKDVFRHLLAVVLWELTDSNRRPSACKADALNQLS